MNQIMRLLIRMKWKSHDRIATSAVLSYEFSDHSNRLHRVCRGLTSGCMVWSNSINGWCDKWRSDQTALKCCPIRIDSCHQCHIALNHMMWIQCIPSFCFYGMRPQLFLLYSLIIHSSMNLFFTTLQAVYTLFFPSLWGLRNYFFTVLTWQNRLLFSQTFR